jgi:hypothetical protein
MTTFKQANQVRLKLKNKVANYSWYSNSGVFLEGDQYFIVLNVKRLDDGVKQIVPSKIDGVSIKTVLE